MLAPPEVRTQRAFVRQIPSWPECTGAPVCSTEPRGHTDSHPRLCNHVEGNKESEFPQL